MPATAKAAAESAFSSQAAWGKRPARLTQINPAMTTDGTPDVGFKVQSIGFEGLALAFVSHAIERAGARPVDGNGGEHDDERPDVDLHLAAAVGEPVERGIDNPGAGGQQEDGFKQSGEVLDLAVAVAVVFIGGPGGGAYRNPGGAGGDKVQAGVRRFSQNAETAREQADGDFEQGEGDRGQQARDGDGLFAIFD